MFRSLFYVITGSENQHKEVCAKIVQHMKDTAPLMLGHIKGYYPNCSSVQEYIQSSAMDKAAWGTDIELLTMSHLLKTCIFSYTVQRQSWDRYAPNSVDKTIALSSKSIYLRHPCDHYDVVLATEPISSSSNQHDKPRPTNSKRKNTDTDTKPPKKSLIDNRQADIMQEWPNFRFHSVNEQWQRTACAVMGLPFVRSNGVCQGGANVVLTYRAK